MATKKSISERDIEREWEFRECRKSFFYFFKNYWKVDNKGEIALPEVREAQEEVANLMQHERRLICLKARQIGWSTIGAAYLFWKAFFFENQKCLALSRREDPEARDIILKVGLGYDELPLWMRRRGPKLLHRTLAKFTFDNRSWIDSDASKDDPARGRTLSVLLCDEFGKFPNPKTAWQSALPATEFGQWFVIGNANGANTWYHKQYKEAKAGNSDFKAVFYSWRCGGSHRDDDWLARETMSYTPAQRAAEYPDNDEECWLEAGTPRFDTTFLRTFTGRLGLRCNIDGEHPVADVAGPLTLWEEALDGVEYIVGADTASGHGDDYSCAMVRRKDTGAHVATLHFRVDTDTYAAALVKLCRYYNNAFLVPERNNEFGVALIEGVLAWGYRNIYRERKFGMKDDRASSFRYGFQTTRDSKQLALEAMWAQMRAGRLDSKDEFYIQEMIEYHYLEDGTCSGSENDDRVMAMAMSSVALMDRKMGPATPMKAVIAPIEERTLSNGAELGESLAEMMAWPSSANGATTIRLGARSSRGRRYLR